MTAFRFLFGLLLSSILLTGSQAFAQTPSTVTQLGVQIRFADQTGGYELPELSKKSSIWWARFPQVPGWVAPANSLPVTAVHVVSEQAEEGVRVWVSVILGNVHEDEKQVRGYVLHEGDKVSVKELADVGVVPIDLKIVRMSRTGFYPPGFESQVSSIEL